MNYKTIDNLYTVMPWEEIDSVVFDVGNVLITYDPAHMLKKLLPDKAELHERLLQAIFRSAYWLYQDMGLMTMSEAAEIMILNAPGLEPEIRLIMNSWPDLMEPIDEGMRAVDACQAHGKKVYLLSNFGDDAFARIEARLPFFDTFDGKIISGRVHMIKPAADIYECLLDTFNLDRSRTMFIDDTGHNVAGAIVRGMHGLCFNAPGKLDSFFV